VRCCCRSLYSVRSEAVADHRLFPREPIGPARRALTVQGLEPGLGGTKEVPQKKTTLMIVMEATSMSRSEERQASIDGRPRSALSTGLIDLYYDRMIGNANLERTYIAVGRNRPGANYRIVDRDTRKFAA
jgi:hypothetical protein